MNMNLEQTMNNQDTDRVIASYLDNQTLETLFFSGAIPSLLNAASDQHFWHERVETLSERRFSFSENSDWRDTYRILSRELSKQVPSFWNGEDNVLVCEILLSLNFKPDAEALPSAAQTGAIKILQFLLQEGSSDPERIVWEYLLPTTEAVRSGHLEAVKLLLADSRVNPSSDGGDTLGQACAAANGDQTGNYTEIVKLLLSDRRVDSSDPGYIRLACDWDDNVEIVKLLLAAGQVNPGAEDVIIYASKMGRDGIVALLLADPRVDPSILDNAALNEAAKEGYTRVVRLLLADPRVDTSDGEALQAAVTHDHSKIVEILLQDDRIDPQVRENARLRWENRIIFDEEAELMSD